MHRDFEEAAERTLRALSRLLPANTLFVATSDGSTAVIYKAFNREEKLVGEGLALPLGESYWPLVFDSGRGPLCIRNTAEDPSTAELAFTRIVGNCSFIGAPVLRKDGRSFAALCALDRRLPFGERDGELLVCMAMLLGYAAELDRTVEELGEAADKSLRSSANKKGADVALYLDIIDHGVRNPLNGVIGMTSLLQETDLTSEQKQYARIIQESGELLVSFMNDVLDLSRIEAGSAPLERLPFDIRSCVEETTGLFASLAESKAVRLTGSVDPDIPDLLVGDQRRVRQILMNIAGNALKFAEDGDVAITMEAGECEEGSGALELLVAVAGKSIRMPQPRIDWLINEAAQTQPFRNGADQVGLGLELLIAKRLVEMMEGRMWAEIGEDYGTSVYFTIRLENADMSGKRELDGDSSASPFRER